MKKFIPVFILILILTSCSKIESLRESSPTYAQVSSESETSTTYITETTAEITDKNEITDMATASEEIETGTYDSQEETVNNLSTKNPAGNEYAVVSESGILVIKLEGHFYGLMPCWGTYTNCEIYAESINDYAGKLSSVNVYSMIIPTGIEFYLPEEWKSISGSQKNKIDYINERLIGVNIIDAYSELEKHRNEYIYSRTDHHWMPLGAYYASTVFANSAKFNIPPLNEFEKVVRSNYVGSMYGYTEDENLLNDPEDFTMYIPKNDITVTYYNREFKDGKTGSLFPSKDGSAYYCSFLGSDDNIVKIDTNLNTKRTLVVFKESYGNAVIPFILDGFDTIYVCDIRYFDLNAIDFIKDVEATDLLFASCTYTPTGVNNKYFDLIKE